MAGFLSRLKDKITSPSSSIPDEHMGEEYVELEHEPMKETNTKVQVRPFVIEDFEDIKEILDTLREGYTIGLINIRPLKDKDIIELKRAINKLKKTCDAVDGDIAGFADDWIVVTPSFARVYRSSATAELQED